MATISHDYRSPLGRLRAIYDLVALEKQKLSPSKQVHLDKIPLILKEATLLIDDLLEVVNKENKSEHWVKKPFWVLEEAHELCTHYQTWIDKKQIQLKKSFPQQDFQLVTHQPALLRVLDNLLSNALKYTDVASEVEFLIEIQENNCYFFLHDQGPGFSAADKAKIFRPFQRLSAQPIEVGNSYGLGLSIVKKLVEEMGGIPLVVAVEKGAKIGFSLPYHKANIEK